MTTGLFRRAIPVRRHLAREREARAVEESARLRVLLARSQAITAALVAALLPILDQHPDLLAALND